MKVGFGEFYFFGFAVGDGGFGKFERLKIGIADLTVVEGKALGVLGFGPVDAEDFAVGESDVDESGLRKVDCAESAVFECTIDEGTFFEGGIEETAVGEFAVFEFFFFDCCVVDGLLGEFCAVVIIFDEIHACIVLSCAE